jgi:adenosylcobinamide-phosphate synthase
VSAIALLLGLLIDHFVGETKRWHPLVGFGNVASKLEKVANPNSHVEGKLCGLVCWVLIVLVPVTLVALLISQLSGLALLLTNGLVI